MGVGFENKRWHYTEKAQRVKEAYELIAAGYSLKHVAQHLGVSVPGARRILSNEIYCGIVVYGRQSGRGKKTRPIIRDVMRVNAPGIAERPLVSHELFASVQNTLKTIQATQKRTCTRGCAKYSGFIFCARCGTIMTPWRVKMRGKQYSYYICRRYFKDHPQHGTCKLRVSCDAVEKTLDNLIADTLTSRQFANRLAMNIEKHEENRQRSSRIAQLDREQRSLEGQRTRILQMFQDDEITREEKTNRLTKVGVRAQQVAQELAAERSEQMPGMSGKQIEAVFMVLAEYKFLNREKARQLLTYIIPRFRVDAGASITSFYWMPDSKDIVVTQPQQSQAHNGFNIGEARSPPGSITTSVRFGVNY
jgi:hypothetical protein